MRLGLGVSILGHAAILGFGFIAFPDAQPFTPEEVEALPVELVTIAEVTDLLEGDKTAEALPEEVPQPKLEVQAEAPAPEPAEEPVVKPVEAAQPAAQPPEPEPEPLPEPELEEVAALPEPVELPPPAEIPEPPEAEPLEPLPEVEPLPPEPVESRVPKARPMPKPVAKPQPETPERELADLIPKEPEQDFESLVQQALLDKQEPTGGGDPVPAPEPRTLGSVAGSVTAEMTQSWLAALTFKLASCWSPPIGARDAQALVVTISFNLLPDGSLAGPPVPYQVSGVSNPQALAATDAALRAVAQCAPYNDIFPPEHYEQWQSILIDFDPSKMLGRG